MLGYEPIQLCGRSAGLYVCAVFTIHKGNGLPACSAPARPGACPAGVALHTALSGNLL